MQDILRDIKVKKYENGGIHLSIDFINFGVGKMFVAGDDPYNVIKELQTMISTIEHDLQTRDAEQRNEAVTEHSGASTVEYGATSNCIECGRRIVFCGDGVWLHCQSQLHGHAIPNGAIVNPPHS